MKDQAQRKPGPDDALPPRSARATATVDQALRGKRSTGKPAGRGNRPAASSRASGAASGTRRKDPLAYQPIRVVDGGLAAGRPPRPVRGTAARARRRNRYRIPPVRLWNRRFRTLRNLMFLVLAVEMGWLALTSPRFEVRTVTVSGTTLRTPEQVARAAGLTRPGNIFRAPAGRAEKALARLPEVEAVRVERHLPGTLAIVLMERRPLASVLTREGYWVIDAHGLVFRRVDTPLPDRPLLVARDIQEVSLGKPLPLVTLTSALECLVQLPGLPLARNVRMHIDDAQQAWLNSPDGFKVRLGPLDNAPERIALTSRILNGPDGKEVMAKSLVLDVTTPDSAVRIPRESGEQYRLTGRR